MIIGFKRIARKLISNKRISIGRLAILTDFLSVLCCKEFLKDSLWKIERYKSFYIYFLEEYVPHIFEEINDIIIYSENISFKTSLNIFF